MFKRHTQIQYINNQGFFYFFYTIFTTTGVLAMQYNHHRSKREAEYQ